MKKLYFSLCFTLASIGFALAQQENSANTNNAPEVELFVIVEQEAVPVGGMQAFYAILMENLIYPKEAFLNNIQGTAFVRFVIDEQGDVSSAEIVEEREIGYGIDEEAIRVIKMTKWVPAMNKGVAVKQRKIIPLKFKLPEEQPKKKKK